MVKGEQISFTHSAYFRHFQIIVSMKNGIIAVRTLRQENSLIQGV